MDDTPLSETRAARLCSWILFAAVSVCSAWTFLRIYTTKDSFIHNWADLSSQLPFTTTFVTHPCYLWSIPALALVGFAKEMLLRNKTSTMIINGVHLIVVLQVFFLYQTGVVEPYLDLLNGMQR